ncbi:hypothetical protein AB0C18_05630 [Nonomuraea muscovyensis]
MLFDRIGDQVGDGAGGTGEADGQLGTIVGLGEDQQGLVPACLS